MHLLIVTLLLPAFVLGDLKIELEYSLDSNLLFHCFIFFADFANVFELGKVDLRRQFDGNFTGVFTPKV